MKATTQQRIRLGRREIDYHVVRSRAALKLRVRVGPHGVEVVQPATRDHQEVAAFLSRNESWILGQLQRVDKLAAAFRSELCRAGEILYRGVATKVCIETIQTRSRGNLVVFIDGQIVVRRGPSSHTPIERSLEYWLRRQARLEIEKQLAVLTPRLKQTPRRFYVRGQRTKWGNCSAERNLSFNWRLILAPDFVLRYLVTHEAVHLVVPDHSAKFWLTVQSLCRETERAKQWLARNGRKLTVSRES